MIEIANTADNSRLLPSAFANLESLACDWAVPTEQELTAPRRLASDFSQDKGIP